jgi:hypothetical protein
MPKKTRKLPSFSANAWIAIFLALFLTSCARRPIAQVATPPVRICPADIFYMDMVLPPFEGRSWSDLAAYTKGLQMHIHTLNQDRAAIREFCSGE